MHVGFEEELECSLTETRAQDAELSAVGIERILPPIVIRLTCGLRAEPKLPGEKLHGWV
jgi:hypothetical protein